MRTDFPGYSFAVGRAQLHIALIPKYRHKIFGYGRIKTFCAKIFDEIRKRGFQVVLSGQNSLSIVCKCLNILVNMNGLTIP